MNLRTSPELMRSHGPTQNLFHSSRTKEPVSILIHTRYYEKPTEEGARELRLYAVLGIVAGAICLALGTLFSLFIEPSPSNLASDLIFLGAGFLLLRKGIKERNTVVPSAKPRDTPRPRDPKQNPNSRRRGNQRRR